MNPIELITSILSLYNAVQLIRINPRQAKSSEDFPFRVFGA
ncbi:TPA: hypothetical protein ACT9LX_002821 [Legionella pneumophila]